MLLLFIDSLLLILLTSSLGILVVNGLQRLFRLRLQSDLLGIFLTGLIGSTIYFNIISFWWPVNYLSLLPLLALCLLTYRPLKPAYRQLFLSIKDHCKALTSPSNRLLAGGLLVLLGTFSILPGINADSVDYHYQSIQWYEKFKVVPGLANVHGRYGFNPAAFIIQSAYSFTGLTGQAIFPLNGVLIGLFLFWVLSRILRHRHSLTGLVYFGLFIMLCRPMLVNISSPSSDPLVLICLYYALISLFELLVQEEIHLSGILLPSLVLLYAPVAKLSAFPVLLVSLYLYFLLPATEKKVPLLLKWLPIALVIYLPWFGRNIILSGYLVYPLFALDLFHPGWKVPRDILMVDYFLINYWPKGVSFRRIQDYTHGNLDSPSFREWFLPWLEYSFKNRQTGNVLILVAALLSPVAWVIVYFRKTRPKAPVFIFLLILYACIGIWIKSSPDFRFGIVFISLSLIFPLLLLAQGKKAESWKIPWDPLPLSMVVLTCFFLYRGSNEKTNYPFTLKDCWLFPLKNAQTRVFNNKTDFPYRTMHSGVKLYLSDSTHHCLNADLPCMSWKVGEIEMRGTRLEDGFINTKDDISKINPLKGY